MRRRSTGMLTDCWVLVRTVSPSCTSPSSGGRSPEMMSTSVDLPLPERPKRAVTPGVGAAKAACSANSPRRLLTDTRNMSAPHEAPYASHQELRREQAQKPQQERQAGQMQRDRITSR